MCTMVGFVPLVCYNALPRSFPRPSDDLYETRVYLHVFILSPAFSSHFLRIITKAKPAAVSEVTRIWVIPSASTRAERRRCTRTKLRRRTSHTQPARSERERILVTLLT